MRPITTTTIEPKAGVGIMWSGLLAAASVPTTEAANDEPFESDADDDQKQDDAATPRTQRREHKTRMRLIVAERLTKSRALSGLSQTEAASLFGYKTPAQLSLWEMNRRMPPLSELIKAGRIYGCSLDYLLGENDEPDRDPSAGARHGILRGVRNMIQRMAELTAQEVDRHIRLLGPHAKHQRSLLAAGNGLLEALAAFVRSNNGAFQNQRGSATVVRLMQEFEVALDDTRKRIALHDSLDGDLRRALAALGDADPLPSDDDSD